MWEPVEVVFKTDPPPDEQMGTKEKFWVEDDGGSLWLFKFARVVRGETRNEDWAEWLVHKLAGLIGIPTAEVRPATCMNRRGIVSKSMLRSDGTQRLIHGNELLRGADIHYGLDTRRENPRYTVAAIQRSLGDVGPPQDVMDLAEFSGFDVIAGYFLLDAWLAARDRHHENWAAIQTGPSRLLAPSFDHGNALGFQVQSAEALALSRDEQAMERWLDRGRSHHFAGKPKLISIAAEALAGCVTEARAYWLNQLHSLSGERIDEVISQVPADVMSEESRTFVLSLVHTNRRRVANAI